VGWEFGILAVVNCCLIFVKVVPGASRDRVAGRYDTGVKVQTTTSPEKGKANAAVVKILAQWLGVNPSDVQLVSSASNPRKQFRIEGLSTEHVRLKIEQLP